MAALSRILDGWLMWGLAVGWLMGGSDWMVCDAVDG